MPDFMELWIGPEVFSYSADDDENHVSKQSDSPRFRSV